MELRDLHDIRIDLSRVDRSPNGYSRILLPLLDRVRGRGRRRRSVPGRAVDGMDIDDRRKSSDSFDLLEAQRKFRVNFLAGRDEGGQGEENAPNRPDRPSSPLTAQGSQTSS